MPELGDSEIARRFQAAVQSFWGTRTRNLEKQTQGGGKIDAGLRGAVTGGTQMGALELLVTDILVQGGVARHHIFIGKALELPGYYRPEKKWDLLVVSDGRFDMAVEFKSQVGPSFGNNVNNRAEEAIGNAADIWVAFREGRFGVSSRPMLAYFILLEDCKKTRKPIKAAEPHFAVDPVFKNASYAVRYEWLCRRLVLERLYDASCFTFSTNAEPTKVSHPADDLTFTKFVAALRAQAYKITHGS